MSSTASNYNIFKLVAGQIAAMLALLLAAAAGWQTNTSSVRGVSFFLGITFLYGVMTFASSYVEEEQNFWYWTSTGWLLLLWVKG